MTTESKNIEDPSEAAEATTHEAESSTARDQLRKQAPGAFKPDFFQTKVKEALPQGVELQVLLRILEKLISKPQNFQVEIGNVETESGSRTVKSKLAKPEAVMAKLAPHLEECRVLMAVFRLKEEDESALSRLRGSMRGSQAHLARYQSEETAAQEELSRIETLLREQKDDDEGDEDDDEDGLYFEDGEEDVEEPERVSIADVTQVRGALATLADRIETETEKLEQDKPKERLARPLVAKIERLKVALDAYLEGIALKGVERGGLILTLRSKGYEKKFIAALQNLIHEIDLKTRVEAALSETNTTPVVDLVQRVSAPKAERFPEAQVQPWYMMKFRNAVGLLLMPLAALGYVAMKEPEPPSDLDLEVAAAAKMAEMLPELTMAEVLEVYAEHPELREPKDIALDILLRSAKKRDRVTRRPFQPQRAHGAQMVEEVLRARDLQEINAALFFGFGGLLSDAHKAEHAGMRNSAHLMLKVSISSAFIDAMKRMYGEDTTIEFEGVHNTWPVSEENGIPILYAPVHELCSLGGGSSGVKVRGMSVVSGHPGVIGSSVITGDPNEPGFLRGRNFTIDCIPWTNRVEYMIRSKEGTFDSEDIGDGSIRLKLKRQYIEGMRLLYGANTALRIQRVTRDANGRFPGTGPGYQAKIKANHDVRKLSEFCESGGDVQYRVLSISAWEGEMEGEMEGAGSTRDVIPYRVIEKLCPGRSPLGQRKNELDLNLRGSLTPMRHLPSDGIYGSEDIRAGSSGKVQWAEKAGSNLTVISPVPSCT